MLRTWHQSDHRTNPSWRRRQWAFPCSSWRPQDAQKGEAQCLCKIRPGWRGGHTMRFVPCLWANTIRCCGKVLEWLAGVLDDQSKLVCWKIVIPCRKFQRHPNKQNNEALTSTGIARSTRTCPQISSAHSCLRPSGLSEYTRIWFALATTRCPSSEFGSRWHLTEVDTEEGG